MSEFYPSFTLYRTENDAGVTMTIQEYGDVDFYDRDIKHRVAMSAEQFELFKEMQERFKPWKSNQ